jgi:hypothetical protein
MRFFEDRYVAFGVAGLRSRLSIMTPCPFDVPSSNSIALTGLSYEQLDCDAQIPESRENAKNHKSA